MSHQAPYRFDTGKSASIYELDRDGDSNDPQATVAEPWPLPNGDLRSEKGLVLFLRFLILFDFGKNLGFFVRIGWRSGLRNDRSRHIEKARRRWWLCRVSARLSSQAL